MKVAMLSPIAWRTPPKAYGPWEQVVSLITEGLVKENIDVTLFATKDSKTKAKLHAICQSGYEENKSLDPKVLECLHISELFENAQNFDLIHNNFDFLPLSYSQLVSTPMITTIHGFSSPKILDVYKKYNKKTYYVSISNSDRSPDLDYIATVYHGIDLTQFHYTNNPQGDYLIYFGRIHNDKGTKEAIEIAKKSKLRLLLAGIIQDQEYFEKYVKPNLKIGEVEYIGIVNAPLKENYLGNALALIHPINFNEPFGLSIIEAMACGTPVIAFRRGSMPEIIEPGINGFLVNSVDEAVEKIKLIHTIQRYNCRKRVEAKFTQEIMVKNYIDVYKRILEGKQ